MAIATFDTLKFTKALQAAGVPDKQADAQANALSEAFQLNFKDVATKDDIRLAVAELRSGISSEFAGLKGEFASLKSDFAALKGEVLLLKWMCGVGLTMGIAILVRLFFVRGPI
jgi:hypothetical protein